VTKSLLFAGMYFAYRMFKREKDWEDIIVRTFWVPVISILMSFSGVFSSPPVEKYAKHLSDRKQLSPEGESF